MVRDERKRFMTILFFSHKEGVRKNLEELLFQHVAGYKSADRPFYNTRTKEPEIRG
jgi:hypothetical protein